MALDDDCDPDLVPIARGKSFKNKIIAHSLCALFSSENRKNLIKCKCNVLTAVYTGSKKEQ